ncbi:WhiB family transcriptional regulator [Streptomyces sp. NBC_01571]|uniref:WhiB family transcriptional regulator n=1 Tax=Streptomyces sp. NBC_01571 TaxID=2975883 RepID=UPI00225AA45C|nr:WhiB family transcriptional regulator [Streptomyces sp. NBC_01571]MCX4580658.1 WhiB family transcriptional regulator [Streptomyces sp. NBC_01571]
MARFAAGASGRRRHVGRGRGGTVRAVRGSSREGNLQQRDQLAQPWGVGSQDECKGRLERERRVWSADAAELFADSSRQKRSKITCLRCPVRTEYLAEALDDRFEFGMWGGMTERAQSSHAARAGHLAVCTESGEGERGASRPAEDARPRGRCAPG